MKLKEHIALIEANTPNIKTLLESYYHFLKSELGYKPKYKEIPILWSIDNKFLPQCKEVETYFKIKNYLDNKIVLFNNKPILDYFNGSIYMLGKDNKEVYCKLIEAYPKLNFIHKDRVLQSLLNDESKYEEYSSYSLSTRLIRIGVV